MSERVRGEKLESGSYAGTGGRPSKYDPSMCEQVIEWGEMGKSRAWMCAKLKIDRETMKRWENENEEFRGALTQAMLLSQLWWEDKGQNSLESNCFQASMWSRSMAARFPEDWREVSRREESGPNGGPIEKHVTTIERVIVDKANESSDPDA